MEPFYQVYFEHIEGLHREIAKTLDGLDPAALDWAPVAEQNSLTALAVHTAGAERFWISQIIGGEPFARDREAEFRTRGETAADINPLLDETLERSRRVLDGLKAADLEQPRAHPRDGSPRTVGWVLAHVLEHEALHLGHMQVIRQWREAAR